MGGEKRKVHGRNWAETADGEVWVLDLDFTQGSGKLLGDFDLSSDRL